MTTIPVLRLDGVIAARGLGRAGLSLSGLEPQLAKAFAIKGPAVALAINSPGGSAAQSALIARHIRRLAAEKRKTVLAFVEDVAASGGYWLATAGDEIVVDETSIVGSIGVIGAWFGFPEALAKLGVERRVHTAGGAKSQLDPFQPENPEDIARLRARLDAMHARFIAEVKARRGAKLRDDPRLFEGEVFLGAEAVALGLADRLGDLHGVLRERYGRKVKLRVIGAKGGGLLRRVLGGMAEDAAAHWAARAAAGRLGL